MDYFIDFKYINLYNYQKEVLAMLKYKIDVIETLKEAGYNSTNILKNGIISQSAMQKFRNGEMVGIKTLEQLCKLLDMQPGNIIKYVDDEINQK